MTDCLPVAVLTIAVALALWSVGARARRLRADHARSQARPLVAGYWLVANTDLDQLEVWREMPNSTAMELVIALPFRPNP